MEDGIRAALAANIERAANRLERVADVEHIPEAVGTARRMHPLEAQAVADAGAAIWEALRRGGLLVPKLGRLYGSLRAGGHTKPDARRRSHVCSNFFFNVMRSYCYPQGEGAFPGFVNVAIDDPILAHELWERHEVASQATGCRMLAEMVRTKAFTKDDTARAAALSEVARLADELAADIADGGRKAGDIELRLFPAYYELRCHYRSKFPKAIAEAWRRFLVGTAPYREDPELTRLACLELVAAVKAELAPKEAKQPIIVSNSDADELPRLGGVKRKIFEFVRDGDCPQQNDIVRHLERVNGAASESTVGHYCADLVRDGHLESSRSGGGYKVTKKAAKQFPKRKKRTN